MKIRIALGSVLFLVYFIVGLGSSQIKSIISPADSVWDGVLWSGSLIIVLTAFYLGIAGLNTMLRSALTCDAMAYYFIGVFFIICTSYPFGDTTVFRSIFVPLFVAGVVEYLLCRHEYHFNIHTPAGFGFWED